MRLRDAKEEDLSGILEIYNEAILNTTATFEIETFSVERRKSWFSNHGGRYPLIVAETEDGKIAGYCSISPFRQSAGYRRTAELSVYVHKEFRRKGLASLMIEEIISRARDLGFHAIVSCIAGSNEASVKLHEQLGFEFVGHLKQVGFKFSRWEDDVFYQILLN
ncbi:MAG: N-acetyltransferase [Nitrososphaerota archaeon]|nr:N-acetyltransferase [Nitrososphaerota archaeon]